MIKDFRDKEAERIFYGEFSRKLPTHIQRNAYRKLKILHHAQNIKDLIALPGNYYKNLKGGRNGQSSIRINDQYRICFIWHNNDAYGVEIIDYH